MGHLQTHTLTGTTDHDLTGLIPAQLLNINASGTSVSSSGVQALSGSVTATTYTSTLDSVINGLTIGKGLNSILTNTAIGVSVLAANTTGNNNTSLGYQSLLVNTTGNNNTATGSNAGANNTTGINNSYLGYNTGLGITTGSNNTIIGANVTGLLANLSNNIIIADGSGNRRINVSSIGNVGIGTINPLHKTVIQTITGTIGLSVTTNANDIETGFYITPDHTNSLVKLAASGGTNKHIVFLTGNTEVMRVSTNTNVGIGTTAPLSKLDIGSGNLYLTDPTVAHGMTGFAPTSAYTTMGIGSAGIGGTILRGFSETNVSGLNLGGFVTTTGGAYGALMLQGAKANGTSLQAISSTDKVLSLLNFGTDLVTVLGSGNVGIGTTTPTARLNTKGIGNTSATFTAQFQNSSDVLSLQIKDNGSVYNLGAGSVVTNTAYGDGALIANTTGNFNTVVGYQTLLNNTSGSNNTAWGYQTLLSNTSGSNNVAIGSQALASNTTGAQSIAIGNSALFAQTIANFNVAVGHNCMPSTTTGGVNTAVGRGSMNNNTSGSENTAMGFQALLSNTVGSFNAAYGVNSLFSATSSDNTAFGYRSGESNTTGTPNLYIGYYAGQGVSTGSRNSYIGHQAGRGTGGTNTGSDNVALGHNSMLVITNGTFNTSTGSNSGINLTSGINNTFNGGNTGGGITTGNNNTISGANVTGLLSSLSNNIILADGSGVIRGQWNSTGLLTLANSSISMTTAGNGILIREGTNATMGIATLVAGTVTVNTNKVTANSRIFITIQGGTLTNVGSTYISARTAATSFTISSTNILDASNISWIIIEPN